MLGTPCPTVEEPSSEVIESSQLEEIELAMPSTPLKTVRSRYAEAWVATGTAPETFRQPPTATVPNIPKVASEEQADDLSVTESESTIMQYPNEPFLPSHNRLEGYLKFYEKIENPTIWELNRLEYLYRVKAAREMQKAELENALPTRTSNTPPSSPKLSLTKSELCSPSLESLPPSENPLEALNLPEDFVDAWLRAYDLTRAHFFFLPPDPQPSLSNPRLYLYAALRKLKADFDTSIISGDKSYSRLTVSPPLARPISQPPHQPRWRLTAAQAVRKAGTIARHIHAFQDACTYLERRRRYYLKLSRQLDN